MDLMLLVVLILGVSYVLRAKAQKQRIALLAQYLRNYDIEKLMERLVSSYMRALDEKDSNRQQQIWELQASVENSLASQFSSFADTLAKAPEPANGATFKISTQSFYFPFSQLIDKLQGGSRSFDLRTAIRLHADGIARVVANTAGRSPRDLTFAQLSALYIM